MIITSLNELINTHIDDILEADITEENIKGKFKVISAEEAYLKSYPNISSCPQCLFRYTNACSYEVCTSKERKDSDEVVYLKL